MKPTPKETEYKPGYYGKKRLSASEWVDGYFKHWSDAQTKKYSEKSSIHPSICFSRQIGAGALEIADLLAENIRYRVIDREILEHMSKETHITKKILEMYDERYPGKMTEMFSMLTSEKTFIKSDYARQLVKTVSALAGAEPTIFVGRGTHLILPRNIILSVRLICSKKYRIDRLANMMNISRSEAETKLNIIDIEQHEFFKNVFNIKEPSLDEFDLVINRDYISSAFQAAKIVECAFEQKFGIKKAGA